MTSHTAKTRQRLFAIPVPARYIFSLGLFFTSVIIAQTYVGYLWERGDRPYPWVFYVSTVGTHYLTWILLVPLLYRLSRLFESRGVVSWHRIATHAVLGVVIATVQTVVSSALRNACVYLARGEWMSLFSEHGMSSIVLSIFSAFVEYWVLIGAFVAVDTYRMYREKEVELVRMENDLNNAQLQALKMQLHPHFLFNTLHSIASLMNENIAKAQSVVTKLGFLLRKILEQGSENTITLREEIEYVRSYLDIEETRFEERLQVTYDIEDDALAVMVPNLILQPLVENAVKHGFARKVDSGHIAITGRVDGEELVLTIADDGCGVDDPALVVDNGGVGLRNVRERLAQMYKGAARLEITSSPGEGLVARVTIPRGAPPRGVNGPD